MQEKLRRAWMVFDVACNVKQDIRKLDMHLTKLKAGADEGLEIAETINHAIGGVFDMDDVETLGFKALNWSPRIDPSLRKKLPWRWWMGE
jgi:hypothetical protein